MHRLSTRNLPFFLLILAKIALVGWIFAEIPGISIGEKSLIGQENSSDTENPSESRPKKANSGVVKTSKDYLDELIDLPSIDSEEIRKTELGRYLRLIEKKRGQIDSRIESLKRREINLTRLESSIEEKLKKIQEEMEFFQQTQQKEKKLQEDRLNQLVEFYKKMPPKKAAPVFSELDRDLVVQLFNRIPKKQTTNILALMDPKKSVELSEYYGRIRSAKEYDLLKEVNKSLLQEFETCKTENR